MSNEPDACLSSKVNHPYHYRWLKDLCGVEPLEICKHFSFNKGNALKYIMRAGKKTEPGMHPRDSEVQDLQKAVFYLNDEIARLQAGMPEVQVPSPHEDDRISITQAPFSNDPGQWPFFMPEDKGIDDPLIPGVSPTAGYAKVEEEPVNTKRKTPRKTINNLGREQVIGQ